MRLIGHRGLAAHAPENTRAGIRRARDFGLRWAEVDVRLSADNVAVLSHDDSLLRCGGVRDAKIKDKTAAELAKSPVACGFDSEIYARECVPSLADIFSLARELEMGIIAELKPDDGNENAVVRAVADAICCAPSQILVSSFSAPMLAAAREVMPAVARAFVCDCAGDFAFDVLRKLAAVELHCGADSDLAEIQKFAAAGVAVHCFTVNCVQVARKLRAAGACGVFTDTGLPGFL